MRIIQTPVRFHPAVGGVEKYVLDLSAQLVRRGHKVTVICANEPPSNQFNVEGISVKRLPYIGKVANTNITPTLLYNLLRTDFDVLHTHMPTPWCAELSLVAAKLKGKPCVLTYHNDVEKDGLLGAVTRLYNTTVLRGVLAMVDRILVTQPRYATESRSLARFPHKVSVLPNGIKVLPSLSTLPREEASILFVSVLDWYHRYKGLDLLIAAMRIVRLQCPLAKLDVVGRGELVPEYQALVQKEGLEDSVHFLGFVSDDELAGLYGQCTVFVLPSTDRHEGFGIVLLEAMSHGVPVITTRMAGVSDEVAAHDAGLVVLEKDPSSLAMAISRVLHDTDLAARLGQNGRRLVEEKYLWSSIVVSAEQIYKEVAMAASSPRRGRKNHLLGTKQ